MSRPVRRTQAISPFGIGSLVDFPGPVSLIHAGLDAWPFDPTNPAHNEFRVEDEPRLARRLGVDFFVQPPDFRRPTHATQGAGAINQNLKLPFLRFPIWHSCPRCGRMYEARYHHRQPPTCEGPIGSGEAKGQPHPRRRTVQVRFVAACKAGHLRDFPWVEWLRLDRAEWSGILPDRWLRIRSTGSALVSGVELTAERRSADGIAVVARKTLANAFHVEPSGATAFTAMGITCDGQNPALGVGDGGGSQAAGCGEHLRALLRGASNLYFADVRSAIYVPDLEDASLPGDVLDLLDDFPLRQQLLNAALQANDGKLSPRAAAQLLRRVRPDSTANPEAVAAAVNRHALHEILVNERKIAAYLVQKARVSNDRRLSVDIVKEAIAAYDPDWQIDAGELVDPLNKWLIREGEDSSAQAGDTEQSDSTERFRQEEYRAFCRDGQDGTPKANLLVKSHALTEYSDPVRGTFERVALLEKLRETRAFVGFSRIYAGQSRSRATTWALISRSRLNWLPAIVVRGEGIFLVFDESKLRSWEERSGAFHARRLERLNEAMSSLAQRRGAEVALVEPRFVLLHTFAHALISQLVFDCGYSSSSLRERIYSSRGDSCMNGLLVYTAAGDAEGTMGGLVRMGEPGFLERTVARAIDRMRWCSSDPVCIESPGQGPDNCNLAACHSCALLPETSCEHQNRLLDRAVLVGTLESRETGFFP